MGRRGRDVRGRPLGRVRATLRLEKVCGAGAWEAGIFVEIPKNCGRDQVYALTEAEVPNGRLTS